MGKLNFDSMHTSLWIITIKNSWHLENSFCFPYPHQPRRYYNPYLMCYLLIKWNLLYNRFICSWTSEGIWHFCPTHFFFIKRTYIINPEIMQKKTHDVLVNISKIERSDVLEEGLTIDHSVFCRSCHPPPVVACPPRPPSHLRPDLPGLSHC